MAGIKMKAPAKLNLILDVTGRRSDGYHLLSMIMQAVELHDIITVEQSTGGEILISCTNPVVPCDEKNICHKAALRFFGAAGIPPQGLSIHIEKNIPAEAGLAGGSTDAAAVLSALNLLFRAGLSTAQLCGIGAEVGADVPFCLVGGTALCKGIGELITPLEPMPDCRIVIAKPAQGMKTPECFTRYDNAAIINHPDILAMQSAVSAQSLPRIAESLGNVLEEVMPLECVHDIKAELLRQGALGALMTGSGTAVFGLFEEKTAAEICLKKLQPLSAEVFLTRPFAGGVQPIQ